MPELARLDDDVALDDLSGFLAGFSLTSSLQSTSTSLFSRLIFFLCASSSLARFLLASSFSAFARMIPKKEYGGVAARGG